MWPVLQVLLNYMGLHGVCIGVPSVGVCEAVRPQRGGGWCSNHLSRTDFVSVNPFADLHRPDVSFRLQDTFHFSQRSTRGPVRGLPTGITIQVGMLS